MQIIVGGGLILILLQMCLVLQLLRTQGRAQALMMAIEHRILLLTLY